MTKVTGIRNKDTGAQLQVGRDAGFARFDMEA